MNVSKLQPPFRCVSSTPRMSNPVASGGMSSGSSTKTNVGSTSMKRRISHAQAVRSTWHPPCRPPHRPASTSAASSATARSASRRSGGGKKSRALMRSSVRLSRATVRLRLGAVAVAAGGGRGDHGPVVGRDRGLHALGQLTMLAGCRRLREPDARLPGDILDELREPVERLAGVVVEGKATRPSPSWTAPAAVDAARP